MARSWIFIGRTDSEAPILWSPDVKGWLIRTDPDAGKDWRREEKGMMEGEMVGWHHQCNGHKFGQALGVGDGQGSLACCSPWGHKQSDMTEWMNWIEDFLKNYTREYIEHCWVGKSCPTLLQPLLPARLLCAEFSRQEHLGGLPFLSSGGLSCPGI